MKKSILFFSITVFFLSTLLSHQDLNGQSNLFENDAGKFAFYDEDELILPSADYSRLYISFLEKSTDKLMNNLITWSDNNLIPIAENEIAFQTDRGISLEINRGEIKSINECKDLIGKIKLHPAVASVYPFLIKDGDIASVENILIFNIDKGSIDQQQINNLIHSTGGSLVETIDLHVSMSYIIRMAANADVFATSRLLSKNRQINYAQPNFLFKGHTGLTPNDPYFGDQWFLHQTSDADIDAPEAWDITTGSSNVVIAIVDGNGFDLSHTELSGKIVDQYCAVNNNNDPSATHPDENHGTPCAGLIGAITNNSYGVAGVGYNCKVMPIRIGYDFNGGNFSTSSEIIQRAGSHIANSSYSVYAVSNSIGLGSWANIAAVREAYGSMRTQPRGGLGAVILASTGNDNQLNPIQYPSLFAHVVGVGASNSTDNRADFSNYGDSTDMVAPGVDCYTLDRTGFPGYVIGDFYSFSGTSAACPVAAGVVALMGAVHPSWTEQQLRAQLYNSCEKVGGYTYSYNANYPYNTWNYEMGYGRINAYLAVQGGTTLEPPTNPQASVNGSNVSLSWTAPGGGGGTEELIYDNNTTTGGYKYLGYTMATHMSPSGPCKVVTIKYYTTTEGSSNTFNAKIFGWSGSQPSTTAVYERVCTGVNGDWFTLDVSAFNITFPGDFTVGFGSVSEDVYIGYDGNLNNGRSWDLNEASSTWSSWNEAYLIRAVVELADGSTEELNVYPIPEVISLVNGKSHVTRSQQSIENIIDPIENQVNHLRGLLGYNIYRDGSKINSSVVTGTSFNDNGLSNGTYSYTITAVYNEGESAPAGPVQATVTGGSLAAPQHLYATNNNEKVSLYWIQPDGSGWIIYNDDNFENSFASTDGGAGLAQLFTLPTYPVTLEKITFYTSNYGNYNSAMQVYILSGNGTTVLQGPYNTAGVSNSWVTWDVNDFTINEPTFMIATYNVNADGPYVGADESAYNGTLYFGNHTEGFTEMGEWEYYYMGSHEALISINKGNVVYREIIKPETYTGVSEYQISESGKFITKETDSNNPLRSLSYYKIYRDGSYLGNSYQVFDIDILPGMGSYNYYVTAYYTDGESGPSNTVTVYWNVGIEENDAGKVIAYPNPAGDVLFVEAIDNVYEYRLINKLGQVVAMNMPGNKQFSIDVSDFSPGIYFLFMNTESYKTVKKIVID